MKCHNSARKHSLAPTAHIDTDCINRKWDCAIVAHTQEHFVNRDIKPLSVCCSLAVESVLAPDMLTSNKQVNESKKWSGRKRKIPIQCIVTEKKNRKWITRSVCMYMSVSIAFWAFFFANEEVHPISMLKWGGKKEMEKERKRSQLMELNWVFRLSACPLASLLWPHQSN